MVSEIFKSDILVLIALYILCPFYAHHKVCTVKVLCEMDVTVGRISSMVVVATKIIIVFSIYRTYPLLKPSFCIQQYCSRCFTQRSPAGKLRKYIFLEYYFMKVNGLWANVVYA